MSFNLPLVKSRTFFLNLPDKVVYKYWTGNMEIFHNIFLQISTYIIHILFNTILSISNIWNLTFRKVQYNITNLKITMTLSLIVFEQQVSVFSITRFCKRPVPKTVSELEQDCFHHCYFLGKKTTCSSDCLCYDRTISTKQRHLE